MSKEITLNRAQEICKEDILSFDNGVCDMMPKPIIVYEFVYRKNPSGDDDYARVFGQPFTPKSGHKRMLYYLVEVPVIVDGKKEYSKYKFCKYDFEVNKAVYCIRKVNGLTGLGDVYE